VPALDNVLVTSAGRGVIVDLGIACHMNLPTITTAAPFAGAPGWMAPEQVDANAERGDWRSDQWRSGSTAPRWSSLWCRVNIDRSKKAPTRTSKLC
jgi:serine/threonine protein kinase